jgi:hypothetical protein
MDREATNYECEIAKGILSAIVHILLNLGLKDEADMWRVENNRVFLPLKCQFVVQYRSEDSIAVIKFYYESRSYGNRCYYGDSSLVVKKAIEESLNLLDRAAVAVKLFCSELFVSM